MINSPDQLLTLTQAAEIAGKDSSVLRKALAKGNLKGRKLGHGWVVTREDLQAWMDDPQMHKTGIKAK